MAGMALECERLADQGRNRISRIFYRPERGNNYLPFDGGREAVRFKMRNTDCRCG
jgi:hypothetical protein